MKWKTLNTRAKQVYRKSFPHGGPWWELSLEWKRFFWEAVLYQQRRKKKYLPYSLQVRLAGPIRYFDGSLIAWKSYAQPLTSDEIARDFQAMMREG